MKIEHNPFDSRNIERVEIVESLAYSKAFENLMYANRVERMTEHVMNNPISINPRVKTGLFPEGLEGIFPAIEYTISDLHISQIENTDPLNTITQVSFKANGVDHAVRANGDEAIYETQDANNERVAYNMPSKSVQNLLALFAYARQYEEGTEGTANMELVEDPISILREDQTAIIERIIVTLGHLDGFSSTETTAFFDTGNKFLSATLTEVEHPYMSELNSQLTLTEVSSIDMQTLHQDEVNVSTLPGEKLSKYAEHYKDILEVPELIFPEVDYAKWSMLCDAFLKVIDKQLASFALLDSDE